MAQAQDKYGRRFATNLWHAFDLTYERVTSGRHDLKNLEAWLKERAAIEDTYSKALIKLASKPDLEAKSSLSRCWMELMESTRKIAQQHQQFAQTFAKEVSSELDKKVKEIKNEKTTMEKEHEKVTNELNKRQANHDKCLARYRDAIKSGETAAMNFEGGKKERLPDPKLKELEKNANRSRKEVETSHDAYQQAVQQLRDQQTLVEQKTAVHLDQFENLERGRERHLQEQFEKIARAHESLKVTLDQVYSTLLEGVNAVDINADINAFIDEHEAKDAPPPHVEYKPIKSEILGHALNAADAAGAATAVGGAMGVGAPKAPASNNKAAAPANSSNGPAMGGGAAKKADNKGGQYAKALYDFESDQPDDLPFREGDMIRVIQGGADSWWRGEVNGRQGSFPANYVQLVEGAAAPAAGPANGAAGAEVPKVMQGKCKALYEFTAQSGDELSFKQDEILIVTGELNGWYVGKSLDGSRVGIFPSNYVQML